MKLRVLLAAAPTLSARTPKDTGINPANIDTSVRPADNFFLNFFLYANGTWIKNIEIPADQVAGIIAAAAQPNPPAGSDTGGNLSRHRPVQGRRRD